MADDDYSWVDSPSEQEAKKKTTRKQAKQETQKPKAKPSRMEYIKYRRQVISDGGVPMGYGEWASKHGG